MVRAPARSRLRLVRSDEGPSPSPLERALVDDAELLAAVLNGDGDAATTLHDRLRPRVAATARRLLGAGDPDLADCVQNTFVEIIRSIDRYRGDCSLDHWAARIAAHVVYRHIRRRRLERKIFDPTSCAEQPEPMSSSRQILMRNLVARVRSKLLGLDDDKVYAFLLHDVLGFDLAEIAKITGVSVAAAQKRLVRGRREVHVELAADPELGSLDSTGKDGV